MKCTLEDIRGKEIINIRTGTKMGCVDDIEFDTETFAVKSFVVYGRYKLFGLLGREDDIMIKCKDIEIIGTDTILISVDEANISKKVPVQPKILYK